MKQLSTLSLGTSRPASLASYLVRGPWMSALSSPTKSPWPIKPGKICRWWRSDEFKGAFDKVWWRALLAHMWAVGVRSKAFKLMQSYLSDRALF